MKSILFFTLLLWGQLNTLSSHAQAPQFNTVKGRVLSATVQPNPIDKAKVWYNRTNSPIDIGAQYTVRDGRFILKISKDRQLQNILVNAAAYGYEPLHHPKQLNFKLKPDLDVNLNLRPIDHNAKAQNNLRSQNPEIIPPQIVRPGPQPSPVPKTTPKKDKAQKPEQTTTPKPLPPNTASFVKDALETNASKTDITLRIEIVVRFIQDHQEPEADLVPVPINVPKPKLTAQQVYQQAMKALVDGDDQKAIELLSSMLDDPMGSMTTQLHLKAIVELADLLVRKNQPHNAIGYLNQALQIMKDHESVSGYKELLPYCHYKMAVAANATMIDTSGLSSQALNRADSIMSQDIRHRPTASPRHRKLWHLIQLEKARQSTSLWEEKNKQAFRKSGVKQNKAALKVLNDAYPNEANAYKGILIVEHADIMQRLRKPRKAIKLYKRASAINEDIYDADFHPDMIRANLGAAMSYSDMGKSNKALEHLVNARIMAICTFPEFDPLLAKLYYLEALNRQRGLPKTMAEVPLELMEAQNQRLSELDSLYLRAVRGAEHTLAHDPDSMVTDQMELLRIHALLGLVTARSSEYRYRIMKNEDLLKIWNECGQNANKDKVKERITLLNGKPDNKGAAIELIRLHKQNHHFTDSLIHVLETSILRYARDHSIDIQNHNALGRPAIVGNEKLNSLLAETYLHKDWNQLLFGVNGVGVTQRALYRSAQKIERKDYLSYLHTINDPKLAHLFKGRIMKVADKLQVGETVPEELKPFSSYFHANGQVPISQLKIQK